MITESIISAVYTAFVAIISPVLDLVGIQPITVSVPGFFSPFVDGLTMSGFVFVSVVPVAMIVRYVRGV